MKVTTKFGEFTIRDVDGEDSGYIGYCNELSAAMSQGETLEELKENMIDVIELVMEENNN